MRILIILLPLLLVSCSKKAGTPEARGKASYFPVKKSDLSGKYTWRGVVRSANRVEIRADRKLKVARVHVRNYDTVKRGQLLIEIDKAETEMKQQEIQEKLKSLQLEQDAAQVKFKHSSKVIDRKRPLLDKGIIPQKEFDEAKREFSLAETGVKSKQLDLDKAKRELSENQELLKSSSYYAPMDGTASGLISMDGGMTPEVQAGQLLAVVSDPSNLGLWVGVEEGSVHHLSVGTPVKVALDMAGDQVFEGKVLNVGGSTAGRGVATQIKTYEVSIGFNALNHAVREGYAGTATFFYATKNGVFSVPAGALRYSDGKDFLLVASSERSSPAPRQVQVGLKTENEVEILSGVTENEYVVVESQ